MTAAPRPTRPPPRIVYLIDAGFQGGTSSAIARELPLARSFGTVRVLAVPHGISPNAPIAPTLADALAATDLPLSVAGDTVSGDLVVLHNPSFLRRRDTFPHRIVAHDLVVVTHENFVQPGGRASFDVRHCLGLIDRASLAVNKLLAPVSPANRASVQGWLDAAPEFRHWQLADSDWINTCDFPMNAPAPRPRDRRGRHSRDSYEKFPPLSVMDLTFPAHAEANVIVGGTHALGAAATRPHWQVFPFGGIDLFAYFSMIDFMVYYISPLWCESFGRVLAEAIAAGKVVITDPATASAFGKGVIPAAPDEVDGMIARMVGDPALYHAQVATAQRSLADYGAVAFTRQFKAHLDGAGATRR